MELLPNEVLEAIALCTDPVSYLKLRLVNKTISQITRRFLYPKLKELLSSKGGMRSYYSRLKPEFLIWSIKDETDYIKSECLVECCLEGRLNQTKALVEEIFDKNYVNKNALHDACMRGHLDIVKYLHKRGYPLTPECFLGAEYNHFPIVYYLHQNKCPFDSNSLAQASCYGNYEMVKWLLEHGYPGDDRAVNHAAGNGDRRMIELLHQYGIRGSLTITYARLSKKSEEFIKWLEDQNYNK